MIFDSMGQTAVEGGLNSLEIVRFKLSVFFFLYIYHLHCFYSQKQLLFAQRCFLLKMIS